MTRLLKHEFDEKIQKEENDALNVIKLPMQGSGLKRTREELKEYDVYQAKNDLHSNEPEKHKTHVDDI